MRGHIADDQWIDVVEGTAAPEVRAHLEGCAACRDTVDDVRAGWTLARDADVPEPSPLYWESFRRRVDQAIARESSARPHRAIFAWSGALATAAALVVAVSLWLPTPTVPPVSTTAAVTLDAWSALPPTDEDDPLPVLVAETAEEASAMVCGEVESCLLDLSEDEASGLAEALRQELSGRNL